jgi:hypothetical protein
MHDNFDIMALKPNLNIPKTTLNRITYDGVNNYNRNHLDRLNRNEISDNNETQLRSVPRVSTKEGMDNYKKLTNRTFTFRKDSALDGKPLIKTKVIPAGVRVTEEGKRNFYLSKGSINISQILKNGNYTINSKMQVDSNKFNLKKKENMNTTGAINDIYNGYGQNLPELNNQQSKSTIKNKGSIDAVFSIGSISSNKNGNSDSLESSKSLIKAEKNPDKEASPTEEKEIKEVKNKNFSSMNKIFNEYNRNVTKINFNPRVKNEAIGILNKSKGTWSENSNCDKIVVNKLNLKNGNSSRSSSMNKIFNEYNRNVTKINFNPRVKSEARENYNKNRGSMNIIQ